MCKPDRAWGPARLCKDSLNDFQSALEQLLMLFYAQAQAQRAGLAFLDLRGRPFLHRCSMPVYSIEGHSAHCTMGSRLPLNGRGLSCHISDKMVQQSSRRFGPHLSTGTG